MSFTRFNYDDARTKKNLQQATDPGKYVLCVPGQGERILFAEDPHTRATKWGGNLREVKGGHPIDIWSDLDNRGIKTTKFGRVNMGSVQSNSIVYPNLKPYTNETRATHPASNYRNMEIGRTHVLLTDPQKHAIFNGNINESTRVKEKKIEYCKNNIT